LSIKGFLCPIAECFLVQLFACGGPVQITANCIETGSTGDPANYLNVDLTAVLAFGDPFDRQVFDLVLLGW
jgi:hypothetical protein